jgi:hypothetical protein
MVSPTNQKCLYMLDVRKQRVYMHPSQIQVLFGHNVLICKQFWYPAFFIPEHLQLNV